MTKTALAKHYGVTLNTVTAWLSKALPHIRGIDGRYCFDLKQVQRWRVENLSRCRPGPAASATSYSAARARKETALASLRELQLKLKQGELLEKWKVEKDAFRIGRIIRDSFLVLPDRLAGILASETDQRTVHDLLVREIRTVLEALVVEQ